MKKYLFLLSIPVATIFAIGFFFFFADNTNGFKSKDGLVGVNDYCETHWDYIVCAFSNVPLFKDYVEAHSRELIDDHEHAQNDQGGCDLDFLQGWKYRNESKDYSDRKRYVDACDNWYAKHAVEILFGNDFTNRQAEQLIKFPYEYDVDKENIQKFKDYMSIGGKGSIHRDALSTYCETLVSSGLDEKDILNDFFASLSCVGDDDALPETSRFSFKTKVFSFTDFLIATAPLIIVIGFGYFVFTKYSPIFSNATVVWMKNKKQFRIFLVATMGWTSLFLIYSMLDNGTINPFDRDDAWFPLIIGLYPLLTFLITYFIVSAEEGEK